MLTQFRLLSYNAFLLNIRVPARSWGREVFAAPAYRDRAHEIGAALAGQYDAVALMEVFDEDEQAAVLEAWSARPAEHVLGPGPSLLRKSSGLVTIVDGARLVRTARHRFVQRGSLLHDADVLANKGVLLAEIDVGGPANMELYSTHLVAGNDFRKRPGGPNPPNPFRLRQVEELLGFVRREHDRANVALVVGDLNVDAAAEAGPVLDEYLAVRDAFRRECFDDVWETHGSGAGHTFCDLGAAARICERDSDDDRYCVEPAAPDPGVGAKRIDHAWLQRPAADQRIAVEVRAVRRRSFPRSPGAPDRDALAFLSDHLALDLQLALTPATGPTAGTPT